MKAELIKIALRGRANQEEDWLDVRRHRWLRWFYTFKTVVCIVLNRAGNNRDYITVASYDFQETYNWDYGAGADWENLVVGRGFFRGWQYTSRSDGYP